MKKLIFILFIAVLFSCEKEPVIECGNMVEHIVYTIYEDNIGLYDGWEEHNILYLCGESYRDTVYTTSERSEMNGRVTIQKDYYLFKVD